MERGTPKEKSSSLCEDCRQDWLAGLRSQQVRWFGFTPMDFDHCAHGWRIYDLMPLPNTLRINVPDAAVVERVWALVLEGCETVRLAPPPAQPRDRHPGEAGDQ